jgi:hypothetical protein
MEVNAILIPLTHGAGAPTAVTSAIREATR